VWPVGGEVLCGGWVLFQLGRPQPVIDERAWTRCYAMAIHSNTLGVHLRILDKVRG
jgi:hypothetical protein